MTILLTVLSAFRSSSAASKHSSVSADKIIQQLQSRIVVPTRCSQQAAARRTMRQTDHKDRQVKRKYKWFTVLLQPSKITEKDERSFEKKISFFASPDGSPKVQIFPNVTEGSLGKCAVVALSGRLNNSCAGAFIDSHDTVVRLGHANSKGYEAKVGVKKSISQVMAARARMTCQPNLKKPGREHGARDPTQPDFWLLPDRCGPPHKRFDPSTQKISKVSGGYEARTVALVRAFMHLVRFPSQYTPPDFKMTSGLKTTLLMLSSRACTSISLFGFGTGLEPHYLRTRVQESAIKHSYSLELWMQSMLMQHRENVCLFDYQLNPPPSNCHYDGADFVAAYKLSHAASTEKR
eukprot:CAMPEP_0177765606 /NCGR_PEP_ID=MMETSP0491_2-20121128/8081_1 /TAXON_ID=63592 /ORGANISM="Tetraselmis chuii, Strain PLY429" /LENGTH=349 /DNA_ID=CAMNT_0019281965 /DNA_START=33 /DNA_END=1082 /DNA_ORIENTATION=-